MCVQSFPPGSWHSILSIHLHRKLSSDGLCRLVGAYLHSMSRLIEEICFLTLVPPLIKPDFSKMLWNFHDLFRLSVLLPMVVLSRVIVAVRIMPQQEINYKRNIDRCCLSWILIYITFIPHFQLDLPLRRPTKFVGHGTPMPVRHFNVATELPVTRAGPA